VAVLRARRYALVALALITIVAGGAYLIAQQVGRLSADDVPRALAQHWADRLAQGGPIDAAGLGPAVELTSAASPFVVIFDSQHRVVASNASLQGETPMVPPGVLDAATSNGSNHVTWQPVAGVREAVFALPWTSTSDRGFVVAGIGLGPTEDRASQVRLAAALTWLAGAGIVVALSAFTSRRIPGANPRLNPAVKG
jgi:hypothetical protein